MATDNDKATGERIKKNSTRKQPNITLWKKHENKTDDKKKSRKNKGKSHDGICPCLQI